MITIVACGSRKLVMIVCSLLIMSLAIMMPSVSLAAEYELDPRNVDNWGYMRDMDYYLDPGYNFPHPPMWPDFQGFRVGDVLILKYNNQLDNIVEVPIEDVFFCTPTNPIAVYSSGFDRLLLDKPGRRSFISNLPDHCNGGQEFSFYVYPAPASVPHTASPIPVASPSPSPVHSTASGASASRSLPAAFGSLALFFLLSLLCF